jgi:hypothetical protein
MDSSTKNISFVYVGPLGDPKVITAMMGYPVEVENIQVTGWEIKRQPLEAIEPESIRENVRSHWDKKGVPYLGSFTLVRNEQAQSKVSKFSIPKDVWLKKRALIEDWGFHAPLEEGDKPWMKFDAIIDRDREGNVLGSYLTETIIDPHGLEHWEREEYKKFVDQMADGVSAFRQSIEGSSGSPEKSG